MTIEIDGDLNDWLDSDRIDPPASRVDGYALYGLVDADSFHIALQSPVPIGTNTTFWLDTDGDGSTGHLIWGFAAGAEYNVNIGSDGIPRLYTGGAGQTFVADLTYAYGADGTTLEFTLPKSLLADAPTLRLYADVNDSVFLPPDYSLGGYTIAPAVEPPASSFDGLLTDWTQDERLETPATTVAGYELYGRVDAETFTFALQSAVAIGPNTTFWLNTDGDTTTGYQIFGFAGGAEFNVNIGGDGVARLYSGAAGETFVAEIDHKIGPDGRTIEFAVPKALIGGATQVAILADVNDSVFLPPDYSLGGYTIAPAVEPPASSFDGLLADWTQDERLETPATTVAGYELYGRVDAETFTFALQSAVAIGPNTTFWLNTDGDTTTGYQIFGFAGGAEFNVNIGGDGVARLYSGAAGETFVAEIDHKIGPDGRTIEFAVPKALIGGATQVAILADVNDSVFLPPDYSLGGYTIAPAVEPPASSFDGLLADWTQDERLETPATTVAGYELYGRVDAETFTFALQSAVAIGPNTTFWLNTDGDTTTGYQIFGFAGGAEFNVNIGGDGVARLYSGAAGETFVAEIDHKIGPDGMTIEFAVPRALIGATVMRVALVADVNDTVFLPTDYSQAGYVLTDPAVLPPATDDGYKIAIVFSETSAAAYFSDMAYSQLVMAAQSQAMAAGIPFDLIGEADLTNLALLSGYDAVVFPSFRNAPANYQEIASVLNDLVYEYGVPLIAAGDFMTSDASGAGLPGNPYERMQSLLGLTRTGGEGTVDVQVVVADGGHPIVADYGTGTISSYSGIGTSYFGFVGSQTGTVIASQIVGGSTYNGVVTTTTGGTNVHFATEAMLADSNLLGQALDWVTVPDGPTVSLRMSRHEAIVASRNDMDQSQETYDIDNGIYDALLPILQEWKDAYDFVGSYYVNVGLYGPDQETNWAISSPYYQQILAMGNEIGSHSYSHPSNTNLLLPDTITQELLDERIAQYAELLDNPSVCFCPYCMREDADQAVIDALAQLSVAEINAILQSAMTATDPNALDLVSRAILEASFKFQFQTSRHVIEDNLGITVTGAAVPGMPETLETARQIIQYYDYLSGGASLVGAGYPGAMGYLSPDDTGKVYIAPNMSFDFTLMGFLGLSLEEAAARWASEWQSLTVNSDLPIVVWPWHDYGVTAWEVDEGVASPYTKELFTNFIELAYNAGSEFVTLADLAQRIAAFEQTVFKYSISGDTITIDALPQAGSLGTFAVDLDQLAGQKIARVANWYAYDDDSVFLDADGGTYAVTLGSAADDVTHITSLGARAQLLALTGDGTDLDFTVAGEGRIEIDLKSTTDRGYQVTGATVVSLTADKLVLQLDGIGTHTLSVRQVELVNDAPTDIVVSNLVALAENTAVRTRIADLLVVDPDLEPAFRNNVLSVSDDRFEIDQTEMALYLKAGQSLDHEATPTIEVTLTAADGALSFSKPLTIVITDVNEAATGSVVISGEAVENKVLTADTSALADPEGIAGIALQWQRDSGGGFVDIAGATGTTLLLTDADAGAILRVVATVTDPKGGTTSIASGPTDTIVDVPPVPQLTPALLEDMTRVISTTDLVPEGTQGGASITNLTVTAGQLTALGGATWLYVAPLNDDVAVLFTYNLETPLGTTEAAMLLDLLGMDDVAGTEGADILGAAATANQYHGYGGNDEIRAGAGDDIIFGGAGDDMLYGDGGNDRFVAMANDGNDAMVGGGGIDTYDLSRITDGVTVNLGGTASGATIGSDTLSGVENVIGSQGNDTVFGSGAANLLDGGLGNDTIEGRGGQDSLIGGGGGDTFVFNTVNHSRPGATTRDIILDFGDGADLIDLSGIDAATLVRGNQAFNLLAGDGTAFTGTRGDLRWYTEQIAGTDDWRTVVAGDTNGDGTADFEIELAGALTLSTSDFIL